MSGAGAEQDLGRWRRARAGLRRHRPLDLTWKLIVFLVGATVLVAGLVMFVTPGPGWLAVIAGLAILATEFSWAERLLKWAQRRAKAAKDRALDPAARREALVATALVAICAFLLAAWWVHVEGMPAAVLNAWAWLSSPFEGSP